MACSCVPDVQPNLPGEGIDGAGWSAKPLDHIPLRERRKLLYESKRRLDSSVPNSVEVECEKASIPPVEVVVKEYEDCDSVGGPSPPFACSVRVVVKQLAQRQDPDGQDDKQVASETGCSVIHAAVDQHSENESCALYGAVVRAGFNCQETEACPRLQQIACTAIQTDAGGPEKVSDKISGLSQCPKIDVLAPIKVEESEVLLSSAEKGMKASPDADFHALMVRKEISNDIVDDLDHIVLKERLRILLAREKPGLSNPAFEGGSGELVEDIIKHSSGRVKEEIHSANGKTIVARDECSDFPVGSSTSAFESAPSTMTGSSLPTEHDSLKLIKSISSLGPQESENLMKSREMIMQANCYEEKGVIPIKNGVLCSSTSSTTVKVKDEPWDNSGFHNVKGDIVGDISCNFLHVKSEWEVHNEYHDDQVEHMCLRDRIRFLKSGENPNVDICTSHAALKKIVPTALERSPIVSESVEPLSIKRPRKRKKTATDSVQTALEEDAPGLLQVLIDKGVTVDEIKLYGEMQSDEALDESFCEDSFAELEAVISKLFSQRSSFIKFPLVRAPKASRASYCLACLVSLIEQARYLQFRKWPAEWGWCRDLQSFIFVFERHNRLVLERPEYGYATYFFELVESLPIDWQIKRLVTAMKLTSCSRISLIENKALSVGEDLTEGEARVLMEYGWVPDSGLGTMLNYCDRVVHDRQNDKDSSEWRSKIGKLLMDGYNGGTIVPFNIPNKVLELKPQN